MPVESVKAGTTKLCDDCGEEKDIDHFQRKTNGERLPRCKQCMGVRIREGQREQAASRRALAEGEEPQPEGMKVCSICGEAKPRTEFGGHAKTKDRLDPRCKVCRRALNNARYHRQREEGLGRSDARTPATEAKTGELPAPCVHKWLCGRDAILRAYPHFYEDGEHGEPLADTGAPNWHVCERCGLARFVDGSLKSREHHLRGASREKPGFPQRSGREEARKEREFEGVAPLQVVARDGELTDEAEERLVATILPRTNGRSTGESQEPMSTEPYATIIPAFRKRISDLCSSIDAKEQVIAGLERQVAALQRQVYYHKRKQELAEIRLRLREIESEERALAEQVRSMEEGMGYGSGDNDES